jgi:TonB family protein
MKSIFVLILFLPILLYAQNQNDSVLISLDRTLCYGDCPAYTVSIRGSGKVKFYGYKYVSLIGIKTYFISTKSVDSLVQRILAMDFFSFNDSYTKKHILRQRPDGHVDTLTEEVTDLPTQYIIVKIGKHKKTVKDYYGAPEALEDLEKEIDIVAGTSRWISDSGATLLADSLSPPPDFIQLDKNPEVIFRSSPEYPEEARINGIENNVYIKAWIASNGTVHQAIITKSIDTIFNNNALRCVMNWKFAPAMLDNIPVDAWVNIPIRFRLNKDKK